MLQNMVFLSVLGLCYTGQIATRRMTDFLQQVIEWRWQLKADPRRFRRDYCHNKTPPQTPLLILPDLALSITCRVDISWRSEAQWLPLCQKTAKKPVYSPRYYHLHGRCQTTYQGKRYKMGGFTWLLFR